MAAAAKGLVLTGTGGVADLKYAYDWQWSPPWPGANRSFGPEWEPETTNPRDLGWPDAPDWLPRRLYDEPGIGYIGSCFGSWTCEHKGMSRRRWNRTESPKIVASR